MKPLDLLETARHLTHTSKAKPRQANLRRAVSTTYYALFHCLARTCADLLVGGQNAARSKVAWLQVYRALDHGLAKNACRQHEIVKKFAQSVQDFANQFVTMQIKRHEADYNPDGSYYKSSVDQDILDAETVIRNFQKAPLSDRRAFAAFVLLKIRKS